MQRTLFIAGNWKMFKTDDQAVKTASELKMIKTAGADYVIIRHSERLQNFKKTDRSKKLRGWQKTAYIMTIISFISVILQIFVSILTLLKF